MPYETERSISNRTKEACSLLQAECNEFTLGAKSINTSIDDISYLIVISIRSFQLKLKKEASFFHQIAAFLILHFSYVIGSIVGLVKILKLT